MLLLSDLFLSNGKKTFILAEGPDLMWARCAQGTMWQNVANFLWTKTFPQSLVHWAMATDSRCGDKLLEYLINKVS